APRTVHWAPASASHSTPSRLHPRGPTGIVPYQATGKLPGFWDRSAKPGRNNLAPCHTARRQRPSSPADTPPPRPTVPTRMEPPPTPPPAAPPPPAFASSSSSFSWDSSPLGRFALTSLSCWVGA